MGSGPVLVSSASAVAYLELKKHNRLNVKFTKKDWCTYKGVCMVDRLVDSEVDVCLKCKYRKPLDIPKILEDAKNGHIEYGRSA